MIDAHWFFGVVEGVDDPLQLGRVRVRPYNVYSSQQADVPTENLQWATVIQSPTRPSTDNTGTNPALTIGTSVFGIFADGDEAQVPLILGRIAGTDSETFHDLPWLARPDVVLDSDKEVKREYERNKNDRRERNVRTSTGGKWDEPKNPYGAEYPLNKVERTTAGHVFEVDDTPDAERIHTYHKSGSFEEYHPDGTIVRRIVGNNYEIIAENDNVHVKGTVNLTIDGNCNTYIKKNWDVQVDGSVNFDIRGDFDVDTLNGKIYLN